MKKDVNNPSYSDMVEDFHVKFNIPKLADIDNADEVMEFSESRLKHLEEELLETQRAAEEGNEIEYLDGLVDLVYVAIGTAYLHGYDFDKAFRRVHYANMKKERGTTDRHGRFDVVKPQGWVAPVLDDCI